MKRTIIILLMLTLLLNNLNVLAAKTLYEQKFVEKVEPLYECNFSFKLDETFNGTWVDRIAKSKVLKVKLQYIKQTVYNEEKDRNKTYDMGLVTIGKYNYRYFVHINQTINGSTGEFHLDNRIANYDGTYSKDYLGPAEPGLLFKFKITNGVKEITVSLTHPNNSGRVYSNIIKADMNSYSEGGDLHYISRVYNIDGTGDPNYIYYWEQNQTQKVDDGKFTDEEGNEYQKVTVKGEFNEEHYDYTTDFKAEFDLSMPPGFVSTDDKVNVKYYRLLIYIDGQLKSQRHLLKLSGNKGEKWFAQSNVQARKLDSEVEWSPDEKLTDNRTIHTAFHEIENFNGETYEFKVGIENSLDLVFNFEDDSKTVMESITLKHDGRAMTKKLKDIKYEGGLVSYYVNMIYPNSLEQQMQRMGVAK